MAKILNVKGNYGTLGFTVVGSEDEDSGTMKYYARLVPYSKLSGNLFSSCSRAKDLEIDECWSLLSPCYLQMAWGFSAHKILLHKQPPFSSSYFHTLGRFVISSLWSLGGKTIEP